MSFDLTPLISELGAPMAVLLLGLIIYFKERQSPSAPKESVESADLKAWVLDHVRDPIIREIQRDRSR
jgi:hypothetical protein